MTTLAIMQARIADDFINESITTAQIANAITTAISSYENTPFFFNQKIASFTTISSQEYYGATDLDDIPNIVHIRKATVAFSGYLTPLTPVSFDEINDKQTSAVIGVPCYFAYFTQQIRLYPIPNAAYTVKLAYIYKLAALVNGSDTNAWMTEGEEMIRQAAKRRLALDTLHSDDMAARAGKLEQEAYDGLLQETRQRLPNTSLSFPSMGSNSSYNILIG